MAIKSMVPGQEDWVNLINKNFIDLENVGTDWQKGFVQGINGFDATNMLYRKTTIKVNDYDLTVVQIGGWEMVPAMKAYEKRAIMKIPEMANVANYHIALGNVDATPFTLTINDKDELMIMPPFDTDSFGTYLQYLIIY